MLFLLIKIRMDLSLAFNAHACWDDPTCVAGVLLRARVRSALAGSVFLGSKGPLCNPAALVLYFDDSGLRTSRLLLCSLIVWIFLCRFLFYCLLCYSWQLYVFCCFYFFCFTGHNVRMIDHDFTCTPPLRKRCSALI